MADINVENLNKDRIKLVDEIKQKQEQTIADCFSLPTIDVMPVTHGHWNYKCPVNGQSYRYCSKCLEIIYDCNPPVSKNYCPNCGARMDEGERKCD